MKILILGLNYAPEKVGIAVYTSGMAQSLAEMGHDVHVISGQPYYPGWKIEPGYSAYAYTRRGERGVDVTRVPHYIPAHPSGARRMFHHFTFALAAFIPTLWRSLKWQPDVVITVAPSLIAAPVASIAAKIARAPSWLHIQDFEVEAAFATGLLNRDGLGARLARGFENKVLSLFDTVSTISPQMCKKLAEKGIAGKPIVELRNWADVEATNPADEPSCYRAEWGITTPHVALYSGNIANKQGIEIVVEAARLMRGCDDLTFVVCGEGPNRKSLESAAADLTNIQFHDLQPKERLSDLVSLATIHLLPQKAEAADLVLPSKLTNMLASARPVVATAAPGTGLADEVEGCGIVTPPEDVVAMCCAIRQLIDDSDLWTATAMEAGKRAEQRWNRRAIISGLENRLKQLVAGKSGVAGGTHPSEASSADLRD